MIKKYFLQFIVYLLFGLLAMADPGLRTQWHAGYNTLFANTPGGHNFVSGDDEQVNCTYDTRKKQSFLRLRFRAETLFRNSYNDIGKPVSTIDPAKLPVSYARKCAHLPPFYYLFLFRLTPF
ncbi:hypothetical protein [Niastella populi]|uniref:hypothetical protein n=1 Tax=Niastella populi TaxID=550983 RepID=UPI0010558E15|nr:hypothetical protein [Niastella populi]